MIRILGILAIIILATTAHAQSDFPNKPVTIVVPFAAGGPTDVVTRILADEVSKVWNQQVIIDNKPGGGSVVGNNAVARAKPDGYSLLMVGPAFVVLPGIRESLPYDSLKDFSGVSVYIDAPLAIVAHPGFAPNTLQELIEEARKRPDRPLTYSSAGVGTTGHMTGELIKKKVGVNLKHISYGGDAAAMPDLLAGRVDFQIATWSNQRPYVEQGKLKIIAVLYRKRLPEIPNVPTLNELMPELGVSRDAFNALAVPSSVPADIKAKIAEGVKAATNSKSYQDRILALGSYPRYTTPQETDTFLRDSIETWIEVAKAANIKVD
jgi:tripartite-type tricarboxylate transporter receptor subunit TctC